MPVVCQSTAQGDYIFELALPNTFCPFPKILDLWALFEPLASANINNKYFWNVGSFCCIEPIFQLSLPGELQWQHSGNGDRSWSPEQFHEPDAGTATCGSEARSTFGNDGSHGEPRYRDDNDGASWLHLREIIKNAKNAWTARTKSKRYKHVRLGPSGTSVV